MSARPRSSSRGFAVSFGAHSQQSMNMKSYPPLSFSLSLSLSILLLLFFFFFFLSSTLTLAPLPSPLPASTEPVRAGMNAPFSCLLSLSLSLSPYFLSLFLSLSLTLNVSPTLNSTHSGWAPRCEWVGCCILHVSMKLEMSQCQVDKYRQLCMETGQRFSFLCVCVCVSCTVCRRNAAFIAPCLNIFSGNPALLASLWWDQG